MAVAGSSFGIFMGILLCPFFFFWESVALRYYISTTSDLCKSLLNIVDNIVSVFNSDREAHKLGSYSCSYELLVGGKWESGQFDRVVFRGEGDARRATVYDFKTNRMRPKETPEEFEMRMQETYAGQLAAYRTAVSVLAGIPPERVAARLLLVGASV